MDPRFWGIVAVLVIGIGVVLYGALSDRAATRRRAAELQSPPRRDIPSFHPTSAPPRYLSELQAFTRADGAPSTDVDDATRAELRRRRNTAPSFGAPLPSPAFSTDAPSGWCVLSNPVILVCESSVDTIRELLPAIEQARAGDRPLVVVAPKFAAEVVDTLRANSAQNLLAGAPLALADEAERSRLAQLVGALIVSKQDLQAGYLPVSALGHCRTWLADGTGSWVLSD